MGQQGGKIGQNPGEAPPPGPLGTRPPETFPQKKGGEPLSGGTLVETKGGVPRGVCAQPPVRGRKPLWGIKPPATEWAPNPRSVDLRCPTPPKMPLMRGTSKAKARPFGQKRKGKGKKA